MTSQESSNGEGKRVPGGGVCTSEDLQVRVFGLSVIAYRQSDHLSVWNIQLYGYMFRCFCYRTHHCVNTRCEAFKHRILFKRFCVAVIILREW